MDNNFKYDQYSVFFFVALLFTWGLSILILPKQAYSESEKRALKDFPEFSTQEFFYNKYSDSLDAYLADNFTLRDLFVDFSFSLKRMRGFQSDELATYDVAFDLDAGVDEMSETRGGATTKISRDSLMKNGGLARDVQDIGKVLFYKGNAIQRFGGVHRTENGLSTEFNASIINAYYDSLGKDLRLFSVITPSAGELLLPSEYLSNKRSECGNIQSIYDMLHPAVKRADVCVELHRHKDEYLYFATDHHWTGRGAYYGFVAFCKEAGITPIPLDSLERHCIHNFLGRLHALTKDPRLANNPDSVEYFKVPSQHKTWLMEGKNYNKKKQKLMYCDFATGINSYGVFLGRDHPLMCIETDVDNERTVMVIKNSYGNPFSTYLAAHYQRMFIADYRKFKGNIVDFCRKNGVDDLILFQNSFSANTGSHVTKIKSMLTSKTKCSVIPRDPDLFKEKKKDPS